VGALYETEFDITEAALPASLTAVTIKLNFVSDPRFPIGHAFAPVKLHTPPKSCPFKYMEISLCVASPPDVPGVNEMSAVPLLIVALTFVGADGFDTQTV
jgi:hypothetical protein